MVGDRSPQPPRETWEALKPDIRRWYLWENQTCEDIQKQLRLRSIFVSQRQIKNRLNEWKYERKKTPHQYYLAMLVVADTWKARGGEAVFEVPKREERVTYNTQKVKKECERVKKRYISRHRGSFKLPTLYEAEYTLRLAGISWKDKDLGLLMHPDTARQVQLSVPPPSWHADLHDLPHRPRSASNRDMLTNCGSTPTFFLNRQVDKDLQMPTLGPGQLCNSTSDELEHQIRSPLMISPTNTSPHDISPPNMSPLSLLPHNISPPNMSPASLLPPWISPPSISPPNLSPPNTSPMMYTPPKTGSLERLSPPTGTGAMCDFQIPSLEPIALEPIPSVEVPWPDDQGNRVNASDGLFQVDPARWPLSPPPETFQVEDGFYSPPYSTYSMTSAAASVVLASPPETILTPNACRSCQPPHDHQSYDFSESIGSLCKGIKHEQPEYSVYLHPVCSFQGPHEEDHKLSASQWAAPYYLQCFSEQLQEGILEYRKSQSMQILQYALEHNNEFILPCLSWTMLVLGQTQRMEQLADFLTASCSVISSQPAMRKSFTYEVPFRYALAWACNDLEEMESHGESLGRSHTQIGQVWGREHPNFFVSGYLYAWHSMWKGDYDHALRLLTGSLPVCERTMGRHDLLTINCLSIAARAYAHLGHFKEALQCYRRAMGATQLLEEDQSHVELHGPVLQLFRSTLLSRHAMVLFRLQDPLSAEKQLRKVLDIRVLTRGVKSLMIWWAAWPLASLLQHTGHFAESNSLMEELFQWHYWEQEAEWCIENGERPPPRPLFHWLRFERDRIKREESPSFKVAGGLYRSQVLHADLDIPHNTGQLALASHQYMCGSMDACPTAAATFPSIPSSQDDWNLWEY
ncbi:uncharacterized protein Z519_07819 [Cladophialophora bantiana CBS 173.52]|uniref:Clr5 domain-containing protein n=1 Tax=Cladophialophora bantiana (strain ATCC 10958 / CBS 173.52 / CDC B-1940 / NIH 8579) TaxID=1442370 RepID=A0A0D2I4N4_CLAB1|nr:uncharacterized protein Z519_07819 [Cladophialophora bantiana CBS 173.52]KIW91849.1 hypothetical protein Z519_07819 [Cladophialophora bantiana CBS 173.52]